MIALNDAAVADAPKPLRPRSTRKSADQSPKVPAARVAKRSDASKTKVSFYLDVEVAEKLAVKAIRTKHTLSDLANEILGREVSSIVFYDSRDSKPTRPADPTLMVGVSAEASPIE